MRLRSFGLYSVWIFRSRIGLDLGKGMHIKVWALGVEVGLK